MSGGGGFILESESGGNSSRTGPLVVGPPPPPTAQDDSLTEGSCSFPPPAATSVPLSWEMHIVNNKPSPRLLHNYGIITKSRLPPGSLLCGRKESFLQAGWVTHSSHWKVCAVFKTESTLWFWCLDGSFLFYSFGCDDPFEKYEVYLFVLIMVWKRTGPSNHHHPSVKPTFGSVTWM